MTHFTRSNRGKSVGQSAATSVVRVIITPQNLALVDPPVPLLKPLIEYTAFAFEPAGPTGHRRAEQNVQVATTDFRGRLAFPAGLLPRCQAELEANGYEVEIEDCRRFGPRFEIDDQFVAEADDVARPLLEALAHQPLGQVEVHGGITDTVEKIALVRKLFPRARLVVAAAARRQVWKYWRSLEDVLDEPVGLRCTGHRRAGKRCWVTTHQQLGDVAAKAHILLLPDAGQAAGDVGAKAVAEAGVPRVYAFVPVGERLDRRTRIRLEGMAGPVIHRLGPPRAGVNVLLVKSPGGTKLTAKGETGLEWKRAAYWGNKSRNKAVVAAVRAFSEGIAEELRRLGLAPGREGLKSGFEQARVVVLVESAEHGRNLVQMLPGALLVDAVPREKGGKEADTDYGPKVPLIITATAAGKKGITANILVCATGGASPLAVKDFPPAADDVEDGRDVLLVDFDDSFDKAAMDDTASRLHDYEARGFKLLTPAKRGAREHRE
jgi:hypothetical protein